MVDQEPTSENPSEVAFRPEAEQVKEVELELALVTVQPIVDDFDRMRVWLSFDSLRPIVGQPVVCQ